MSYDYLSAMTEFDDGSLSFEDTLVLFQYLIDTALIKELPGHYLRTARGLIEAGYCVDPECPESDLPFPRVFD